MKKLFYLFFTAVVMLILPACNGDPDFLKDMPPASGDGNTDDDENGSDEESSVDPNFQIYLCFGESNMEGTAAIADTDLEGIDEHFKVMAVVSDGWDRVAGSWYTAVPPLCRPSTGLSPIDYFGRKMLEGLSENNPDVTIGVIMVAVSDAGIKAFHKTEYKSYYEAASENVKNLMNCYDGYPYGKLVDMAREAQKQGTIKGILMHHGETDANEDYWEGTVKDIYDNLISDLSLKAENTPLLVGEMCKDKDFVANNDKIDNLTSSIENCYIVSSEGCTGNDNADDNKHFSAEGYRTLGEHYAETMLNILAGLSPEQPDDEPDKWFEFVEGKFGAVMGNPDAIYDWETGRVENAAGFHGWKFDPTIDLTTSGKRYLIAKFKEITTSTPRLVLSSGSAAFVTTNNNGLYSVIDLTQELKADNGEIINPAQITYVALQCVDNSPYTLEKVYFSDTNPLDEGGTEEPDEPENDPTKWFEFAQGRLETIWGTPSMDWSSKKVYYNGKDDIIIGWKFNGSNGNPSPLNLENGGYLIAKVSNIQGSDPQFYISNNPNLSFSLYIESENCKTIDGIWYSVIDLSKAEYKDLNGENVLLNNIQLVGFRTEKGEEGNSSFVVEEIILSDTNPLENQSSDE